MGEKSELHSETVSLPPNYAPSETFTESPPPAYRSNSMAIVRIAKLVCFTLLAMTMIVGFFVITHKYIQTKNCDCRTVSVHPAETIAKASFLAGLPGQFKVIDNNHIENQILLEDSVPLDQLESKDSLPDDEKDSTMPDHDLEEVRNKDLFDEDEDVLQIKPLEMLGDKLEVEEVRKGLKLSKNMLLGESGNDKDVHCRVEKKQQKLADGIMSQAIIVTCDDDDENVIKSSEESDERTPFNFAPKPPLKLFSTIMKILASKPPVIRSQILNKEQKMFPLFGNSERPLPFFPQMEMKQIHGPSPIFMPMKKFDMHMRHVMPESRDEHIRPLFLQRPPPEIVQGRSSRMLNIPPPPMRLLKRFEDEENINELPFSNGQIPIKLVRLSESFNMKPQNLFMNEDNQEFKERAPPMHPILKFFPTMHNKIIRIRPMPENFNEQRLPFPLPRGALPLHHFHEEEPPHPMPEASGRALPAPVALPGIKIVRLPLQPQGQFVPGGNLFTHMEMKNEQFEGPRIIKFRQESKEFGPPKVHTLMGGRPLHFNPEIINESNFNVPEIHEEQLNGPEMHEERFNGPEIHEERFNGPEIHDERFNGPEIHEERFNGPEIHDERFNGPEIHDERFNRPEIHEDRFNGPEMYEERFNIPEIREERFNIPEIREERFNEPEIHENRFNAPEIQEKRFDEPEIHENENQFTVQEIFKNPEENQREILHHIPEFLTHNFPENLELAPEIYHEKVPQEFQVEDPQLPENSHDEIEHREVPENASEIPLHNVESQTEKILERQHRMKEEPLDLEALPLFNPEGRTSLFAQLNPDAEIVQGQKDENKEQ